MKSKNEILSVLYDNIKIVTEISAEFLSTLMLTFWGCMAYVPRKQEEIDLGDVKIESVDQSKSNYLEEVLMPAFQAGFAVWMFIVLWWKICVVNFNPAITAGLFMIGELSGYLVLPFIAAQCLGSILGALIAAYIKGADNIGPFIISENSSIDLILMYEIVCCGTMCFFTFMMVGDKSYNQQTGPLAVGMTVFQAVLGGYWIGAGLLNPARAIGPAVVVGGVAWTYHWVWWVGDIFGAIIFSFIYRLLFAPVDKAWIFTVFKPKNLQKRKNSQITAIITEKS